MNENDKVDTNLLSSLNQDNYDKTYGVTEPKGINVDASFYTSQTLNTFDKTVGVKTPRCKVVYVITKGTTDAGPQVGSTPWTRRNAAGVSTNTNMKVYQAKVICPNAGSDLIPYPVNATLPRLNELDLMKIKLHTTAFMEYDANKIQFLPDTYDEVVIEYIGNDKSEAKILEVYRKETPTPQENETSPTQAFNNSDGSTLADAAPLPVSSTNQTFNFTNLCKDSKTIVELANRIGIPPAVMAAFRAVESGGAASAIRFEPHLFNKESSIKVPYTNTGKGFSTVTSETNKSAFDRAYSINKGLAIKSTSWGSYQVLGWALLAIPEVGGDVNKAVSIFYSDPVRISQEIAVSWFKKNEIAITYANNLDFARLAKRYNGPLYANNQYDVKLKQAYDKAILECEDYKTQNRS